MSSICCTPILSPLLAGSICPFVGCSITLWTFSRCQDMWRRRGVKISLIMRCGLWRSVINIAIFHHLKSLNRLSLFLINSFQALTVSQTGLDLFHLDFTPADQLNLLHSRQTWFVLLVRCCYLSNLPDVPHSCPPPPAHTYTYSPLPPPGLIC